MADPMPAANPSISETEFCIWLSLGVRFLLRCLLRGLWRFHQDCPIGVPASLLVERWG
jgi:hypothetical protein